MQQMTDDRILALILEEKRVEEGFRALMGKYQERLYWHIRRMLVEHQDTDDVLQNTFIKVYRNLAKFKGNSELYTWLYRIATNESLNFLKKRRHSNAEDPDESLKRVSEDLLADEWCDGDEIERKLHRAVSRLPEKQRLVFQMRYFDEMSYRDISSVMQTSVGGLKAQYHHAVKKVEKFVTEVSIQK